jgi:hypothetical protein
MRLTAGMPSAIYTCARALIPFVWDTLDTGERAVMTFYRDDQDTNEIALDPRSEERELRDNTQAPADPQAIHPVSPALADPDLITCPYRPPSRNTGRVRHDHPITRADFRLRYQHHALPCHDESARSRPNRVAELDVMHTPAGAKERASSRS